MPGALYILFSPLIVAFPVPLLVLATTKEGGHRKSSLSWLLIVDKNWFLKGDNLSDAMMGAVRPDQSHRAMRPVLNHHTIETCTLWAQRRSVATIS